MNKCEIVKSGDKWLYEDNVYQVVGTAAVAGRLKDNTVTVAVVIYKRVGESLQFIRDKVEFIDKFRFLDRHTQRS